MKKFLLLLVFIPMVACKQGADNYTKAEDITTEELLIGKQYLEMYCYACHSPETAMDERLAPPMAAVKSHYIEENTTKEEFLQAFTSWVKNPSEATSKMPGAIRNFGLMPYTPYPDSIVRKIGEYLYLNDVESPDGLGNPLVTGNGKGNAVSQKKQMRKRIGWEEPKKTYSEKGREIVTNTQGVLGKKLLDAIHREGLQKALEFCNVNALPLTDSMSELYNTKIQRVSDRFRNSANKATARERTLIEGYQKQLDKKLALEPIIDSTHTYVQFYYPIITNELCLKCHGSLGSNIEPKVWATIQELYPEDKATGYGVNEVRGLWSIQMEKE